MIINAKEYNKKCSCGRTHAMTTELCVIEKGCLSEFDEYLKKLGISGRSAAVYDDITYEIAGSKRPRADKEIILNHIGLHADNAAVDKAIGQMPENCDYLIAVGSGTIHDITRYCAYKRNIPFISCPTAASVDGFCSSVAAMTWFGYKKTLTAKSPKMVIADLDIISNAPMRLTRSGCGDMIGKFIALAEWKIANLLTGEFLCDEIYNLSLNGAKAVVECVDGLKNGELKAFEKLTYGLLMSGLAMQMLGNSRCASGAEHHISHLIEMEPEGLKIHSDALHGEKVGVGTLLAAWEYNRLVSDKSIVWKDYRAASEDYIKDMFGSRLSEAIIKENAHDAAAGITAVQIEENMGQIQKIISEIPDYDKLAGIYTLLGMEMTLGDISVPETCRDKLLEYSPLVRNRLTLMRLRRALIE